MTYNTAALAAHKYLLRHKAKANGNGGISSPSDSGSLDGHEDVEDLDSIPSAPVMERQTSHATRSTRGGTNNINFYDNKHIGLEGLGNFELPNLERLDAQDPRLPPIIPAPYNKAKPMTEANGPPSLAQDDVNADVMAMKILTQYNHAHGAGSNFDTPNGGRKLLEAVASHPRDSKYVAYLQGERPSADELRVPTSNLRGDGGPTPSTAPPIGGTPMSRQSSQGGTAMSRQGSSTRGQRRRGGQ